jgi:hypothetical protein
VRFHGVAAVAQLKREEIAGHVQEPGGFHGVDAGRL